MKIIKQWLEKKACRHECQVHTENIVWEGNSHLPVEYRQVLICKRCGEIKKIKL